MFYLQALSAAVSKALWSGMVDVGSAHTLHPLPPPSPLFSNPSQKLLLLLLLNCMVLCLKVQKLLIIGVKIPILYSTY